MALVALQILITLVPCAVRLRGTCTGPCGRVIRVIRVVRVFRAVEVVQVNKGSKVVRDIAKKHR